MKGAVEVWNARTGARVGTLGTHAQQVLGLVFSRDRQYLASASADGEVKLWDATRLGKEQEPRRSFRARVGIGAMTLAFSPDGQRLVAGGKENTVIIWDVQTGQEQTLRGHSGDVWATAFSPDREGRWVASAGEDSTVKVWDSHTGTLVRSFRGHTGFVTSLAFSPDGRRLYSGSRDGTVKVWDLTSLPERALADYTQAIRLQPNNAPAHNSLAWLLATGPDPKLRDPAQAVRLAHRAVELAPRSGLYWKTLGAARYRAGDWKAAVAALERSMALRNGGDSSDWFFLAMTHWQLGDQEQAHKRYDEAVQWMDKNKPPDEELHRFRAEAAELLGLTDRPIPREK
jgi:WD40 repeat protein